MTTVQIKAPSFLELYTPKLITVLREGYGIAGLRADAVAGMTVAIVAIPLSMAWLVNSVWLGRAQERRRAEQAALSGSEPERTPPIVRAAASSSVRMLTPTPRTFTRFTPARLSLTIPSLMLRSPARSRAGRRSSILLNTSFVATPLIMLSIRMLHSSSLSSRDM